MPLRRRRRRGQGDNKGLSPFLALIVDRQGVGGLDVKLVRCVMINYDIHQ